MENGDRNQENGDWELENGDWKLENGDQKPKHGAWRPVSRGQAPMEEQYPERLPGYPGGTGGPNILIDDTSVDLSIKLTDRKWIRSLRGIDQYSTDRVT